MLYIGATNLSNTLNCTNGVPPGSHQVHVESNDYITMAVAKDPVNGPWTERVILDDHEGKSYETDLHGSERKALATVNFQFFHQVVIGCIIYGRSMVVVGRNNAFRNCLNV